MQPVLNLHGDFLAGKLIESGLDKCRQIGIRGLAPEFHRKWSGRVPAIREEARGSAGGEKFAALHGLDTLVSDALSFS